MNTEPHRETDSPTPPVTLRDLAGVPTRPPAPEDMVLIIIDAQREYLDGALPLPGIGPALDRMTELVQAARQSGHPVVHVAHRGQPGGLFDPGDGGRIIEAVRPAGDEPVVHKALPNAFAGTELLQTVSGTGRTQMVLCGFMTHMCVSSTARAALDLGLATTVVSDATASRDLPSADGAGVIEADLVQAGALAALADRFAAVIPTSDLAG